MEKTHSQLTNDIARKRTPFCWAHFKVGKPLKKTRKIVHECDVMQMHCIALYLIGIELNGMVWYCTCTCYIYIYICQVWSKFGTPNLQNNKIRTALTSSPEQGGAFGARNLRVYTPAKHAVSVAKFPPKYKARETLRRHCLLPKSPVAFKVTARFGMQGVGALCGLQSKGPQRENQCGGPLC